MRTAGPAESLVLVAGIILLTVRCGTDPEATGEAGNVPVFGCEELVGETIRFIVPTSPGGGQDVDARLLEPFFEEALGAEITVENRASPGGLVGARLVNQADPDGRTLGILNASARLVAELSEETVGLHPVDDFTLLGRIATEDPVWLTAQGSRYQGMEQILAGEGDDPILFGISGVGGSGFLFASVAAELLGLDIDYVAGYPGGREMSLGLMRTEFDVGGFSFESARDRIEAGDLIPILQLSEAALSQTPFLRGVPVLGGPDGLVRQVVASSGVDPATVTDGVAGLTQLFETGRVVVGPPALSPGLARCLSERLAEVARDSAFLESASRAQRTISFQDPDSLAAALLATADERAALAPILRRHIDLVRGGSGR